MPHLDNHCVCITVFPRSNAAATINIMRLPQAPATADQEQCLVQSAAANRWYWQSIMLAERIGGCPLNNVASRFVQFNRLRKQKYMLLIHNYSLSVMIVPVLRLGLSTEAGNGPLYL